MTIPLRWWACVVALVVLPWAEVRAASVSSTFRIANNSFQRGDYVTTVRILRTILRKYPEHQASSFLMGRALYRMGKPKLALPYFRRAGDFINPDGAFEYGITFFSAENCTRAVQGFVAVPRGNPYRDLAQFYSGVCMYRQRRWDAAERLLRRARNLPNNLAATRRDLLQAIERQQASERQGRSGLGGGGPTYAPVPLPNYAFPSYPGPYSGAPVYAPPDRPPTPGKKDPMAPTPKPAASETASGFSNTIKPSATVVRRGAHSSKHSIVDAETSEEGVVGGVDARLRYDVSGKGSQPSLLLGAKLDVSSKTFSDSEVFYTVDSEDPTAGVTPNTKASNRGSRFWQLALTPAVNLPITGAASIEATFAYTQFNPQMRVADKQVSSGPQLKLSLSLDPVSLSLGGSRTSHQDKTGPLGADTRLESSASVTFGDVKLTGTATRLATSDPVKAATSDRLSGFESRMILSAAAKYSWETLSLTATGTQFSQAPPAQTNVSGVHGETRAELTADKDFGFGASISATAMITKISGYLRANVTDKSTGAAIDGISATGGRTGFIVTGKMTPVEWGFASVSYSRYQYKFDIQQPEYTQAFQMNTIDLISEYIINVGVSKAF